LKAIYNENNKPLKKEIEEDFRRRKHLPCLWIGTINIVKMTIITKRNLHVQCNPHQNSNDIHHRDKKINPKVNTEA
jgi:hypothetical protein